MKNVVKSARLYIICMPQFGNRALYLNCCCNANFAVLTVVTLGTMLSYDIRQPELSRAGSLSYFGHGQITF